MENFGRAVLRLWRVGLAGALAAIAVRFVQIDYWMVVPITAVVNAVWKYLRQRYPDFWLWKLM